MYQINPRIVESFFSTDGKSIYDRAYHTVKEHSMEKFIESGVLVGLSGGADSVMLLLFLLEYKRRMDLDFSISALHVNHMIRGDESDRDEAFSKSICDALNVQFYSKRIDVPLYAKKNGIGLEEAARNIRYEAFNELIAGRNDISSIAVAHNMSDSAETVLFNILRGCGSKGASGIRPIRGNVIRPLINISKSEIVNTLNKFGIDYVSDSSNISTDYTRNYIRLNVMPVLAEICENPEKMLGRFADNLRSDNDILDKMACDFLTNHSVITNSDLLALDKPILARVISFMAEDKNAGVSSAIISDIYGCLINDSFTYSIIGGRFVCERGRCYVTVGDPVSSDYKVYLDEESAKITELGIGVHISQENIYKTYSNVYNFSIQANISSAIIKGRLFFRAKKDGDTVFYGGMTHKIKKLFSDRKIPLSERRIYPVLCDDKGIVWVPGFGIRDDGVSVEEKKDIFVLIGSDNQFSFLK